MTMRYAYDSATIVIDGRIFVPSYAGAPSEIRAMIDAAGGLEAVLPYEAPAPALPDLTPRQLRLMMLTLGLTEATVLDLIEAIPNETERAAALIEWNWATRYQRHHQLVVRFADALAFDPVQFDALWLYAADL